MNSIPQTPEVWPAPVSLVGRHATLVPLSLAHKAGLAEAAADGELWRLWYTAVPSPARMQAEIERRLDQQARGGMLPFAVLDAAGQPAGMTAYMNIDARNRHVEIGSTWYRKTLQRTPLNTECKILLLGHAFEALDCIAVEFRTHFFNHQSRRAIERLGAKQDGILRNHTIGTEGNFRDTVVYSIIQSEWPTVRQHLRARLTA